MAITIKLPTRAEEALPLQPAIKQPVAQEVKQPEATPKEPNKEKELDNG